MTDSQDTSKEKDRFFYPIGSYRGEFTPEHLAFNANLQEFAQRVSIICGLETGGKISSQDAYKEIKQLWHQLKKSKQELLDQNDYPRPDLPEDNDI
ncbi:DUF7219 family protein [Leptothermofonsia sp. ETS-13]|uniref:DUF7219 family protein n=1 Tax=Leptothermofonsia sp. ETS-13 TaxID=3035696 RepID=UPI003BA000C0